MWKILIRTFDEFTGIEKLEYSANTWQRKEDAEATAKRILKENEYEIVPWDGKDEE